MTALGGPDVVLGPDRLAYARTSVPADGHHALLVPAPGGRSVLGSDMADLAGIPDVGLLIAVSSEGGAASQPVTMGRNLAAGRRTA